MFFLGDANLICDALEKSPGRTDLRWLFNYGGLIYSEKPIKNLLDLCLEPAPQE